MKDKKKLKEDFFKKFTRDDIGEAQLCADGEKSLWGVTEIPFKDGERKAFQECEIRPDDVWGWIENNLLTKTK